MILSGSLANSTSLLAENEISKTVNFNYFGEPISIRFADNLFSAIPPNFDDKNISYLCRRSNIDKLKPTIQDLALYQSELNLSDWLFYKLIQDCAFEIYNDESQEIQRVLFCWAVLGQLDYKIQLNFSQNKAFLSVFTMDKLFDVPIKKYGVGWMVEVSGNAANNKTGFIAMYRANQFLNGGKIFSFKMDRLPSLTNVKKVDKHVKFEHENKFLTIDYQIDKTLINILESYPQLSSKNYVDFPLSMIAYNSLIPELKNYTDLMSNENALRFLLSFTRQAFHYGSDSEYYKKVNVSFCPEQTLFYSYSDCEDRSILFAYLVNEIIRRDVIIIDFDDHVAVGVRLDKFVGKPISHKNHYYTYCDPTGPSNDLDIGDYPEGLIHATYTIVGK